jgi:hypothetical protein
MVGLRLFRASLVALSYRDCSVTALRAIRL